MNPGAAELHLQARPLAVHHEGPAGAGHRVLDQGAGEMEPSGLGEPAAGGGHPLDHGGDRRSQADPLQKIQGGAVDACDLPLGERPVAPALDPRPDRPRVRRRLGRLFPVAGGAAAPLGPPARGRRFGI